MLDMQKRKTYIYDPLSDAAVSSAADLPTERARNGMPTLAYRGFRVHSGVDPEAEAVTLAETQWASVQAAIAGAGNGTVYCIVLGPGLGYIINAVEQLNRSNHASAKLHFICVETNAEIARKALELSVWEGCNSAVTWIAGEARMEVIRQYAQKSRSVYVIGSQGYKLNRDTYDAVLQAATGKATAERPMRILVPTPLYGGSYPAALHCAAAFESLGHSVELLDLSAHYDVFKQAESVTGDPCHVRSLQGMFTAYLAELITARAIEWNADLVWALAQTPLTTTALQELKVRNIHTALWFVEDFTVFPYWIELAPHFDAVFTIQRGEFHDRLREAGVRNAAYLPCAANPAVHRQLELTPEERQRFGSNVAFVGAGYYNRQVLFAQLPLKDFKIWGNDWPKNAPAAKYIQEHGRRVTSAEAAAIYCASRINLNLHSSPQHSGVNPHGDFVNPRTFEIASCGAFQLVDRRSELPELFEPGSEIVVFDDPQEIPALIEYYLEHPDERKAVAERSRRRTLSEHTYEHRMSSALQFLEERLPRLAARKRGPNYVSSLKQAVADDVELQAFLSAFDDDDEIDLDRIVSHITLGTGALSRPEGLFLLMKEFRDWGREKGVIR